MSTKKKMLMAAAGNAGGGGDDGPIVTDGLIWHLDAANPASYSGSGTTWSDLIGSENATLRGGPPYSTTDANGSGAFFFDGSSQYATTNFSRTNADYSVSAWCKTTSQDATTNWLMNTFESSSAEWWGLGINSSMQADWSIDNDSTKREAIGGSVAADVWSMITGTRSGNTTKVYIQTNLVATVTNLSTSTITGVEPIWIASRSNVGSSPSEMYRGWISDLKFYSKELTASEISDNYDALKDRYGL